MTSYHAGEGPEEKAQLFTVPREQLGRLQVVEVQRRERSSGAPTSWFGYLQRL